MNGGCGGPHGQTDEGQNGYVTRKQAEQEMREHGLMECAWDDLAACNEQGQR